LSEPRTRVVGGGPDERDVPVVADEEVAAVASAPPRTRSLLRRVGLVGLIGILGTLVFATLWLLEVRSDRQADRAEDTARDFVVALTNFDGDTINEDFDRIESYATDDFVEDLDRFFDAETRQALATVQASSRGQIRHIYMQSFDDGRARFFAVVDQTIANSKLPAPQSDELRLEFGLRQVNGNWRVYDLRVLQAPPATVAGGVGSPTTTAP
jgi:hypothetical protein